MALSDRVRRTLLILFAIIVVVGATGVGLLVAGSAGKENTECGTLPRVVASVSDQEITRDLLLLRLDQVRGMNPQVFAGQSPDQLHRVCARLLENMIQQNVIRNEAERMKLEVSDADLEVEFQRIRGSFDDEKAFEEAMKQGHTDPAAIRTDLRQAMLVRQLEKQMIAGLAVSEEEINKFFTENKGRILSDRVRVRHILVKDEKEAKDLLAQYKKKKDFGELARAHSQDPGSRESGGDLGWVRRGQTVPEFEKLAFSLKPGTVGGPVKTQFGYHLIRVEEVSPAAKQSLADYHQDIETMLRSQAWAARRPQWVDELKAKVKIKRAEGMEVAADTPAAPAAGAVPPHP